MIKCLCVGRLHRQKNHKFLFPLFKDDSNLSLDIIGTGELSNEYQDNINQEGLDINIISPLNQVELFKRMVKYDVFLLPSIYEAFGLVLVEAYCMGIPIIASDLDCLVEVKKKVDAEDYEMKLLPLKLNVWEQEIFKMSQQNFGEVVRERRVSKCEKIFSEEAIGKLYEEKLFG